MGERRAEDKRLSVETAGDYAQDVDGPAPIGYTGRLKSIGFSILAPGVSAHKGTTKAAAAVLRGGRNIVAVNADIHLGHDPSFPFDVPITKRDEVQLRAWSSLALTVVAIYRIELEEED